MQLVVLSDERLKEELLSGADRSPENIIWIRDPDQVHQFPNTDVLVDLLYEQGHLPTLESASAGLVVIHSVETTLKDINTSFVRINAWPGFLSRELVEASCLDQSLKEKSERVFSLFNKRIEWLPDVVGFVTPRVISMIINEAYLSLEEGVSTREEIDIAMKLGTNYPYGPFEWSERIGLARVRSLLEKLRAKEREMR